MRRFFAALALACAALLPAAALAQTPWKMTAFKAEIDVGKDGGLLVTETIGAEFLEPRHGIYRYVPQEGIDAHGKKVRLGTRLESATVDGSETHVATSREKGNVVWRIGDADRTLEGSHAYVLRYRVNRAIRMTDAGDILSWNVTGEGWDAPLSIAAAEVRLPGAAGKEFLEQTSSCYTGAYGSSASECQVTVSDDAVSFATLRADSPLTLIVGLPKGLVAGPTSWQRFLEILNLYGMWILPFITLALMTLLWRARGSDAPLGAIAAQYEAPAGLTPAETRALLAQSASSKDIAVTIIDLATRGYLRIEENQKKGVFGTSKEYILISLKEGRTDASLQEFERVLLSTLFAGPVGERVAVADLKRSFSGKVTQFEKSVMNALVERGFFASHPEKVRAFWFCVALALWVLAFFTGPFLLPLLLSGAVVAIFGFFMPKLSPAGRKAARHARGYREFISAVEKYRTSWMEDQNVFFRTLPYAMAFGLGAKWGKAFEGLHAEPPAWYQGASMAAWTPVNFTQSLDSWTKSFYASAIARNVSSPRAGGHFSGGGFGGGGGGSW